ncbi:hypothetical protein FOQG_16930 [Fusarium oxysporum f. sp. raphani 54005]|uniref:Uncharacterized protein n=2 Tax=Fusarium oxysporum TaxID=5507 RepID=X0B9F9_FUSOX|nr:hypothetical protein FOVG_16696 [Fusarium oxysporum f. sp. pisi HDV247]EXK78396.1 hypothetical protein FOQG_16930 [Fusarium oxysporum f. sp. raphani 54005]
MDKRHRIQLYKYVTSRLGYWRGLFNGAVKMNERTPCEFSVSNTKRTPRTQSPGTRPSRGDW